MHCQCMYFSPYGTLPLSNIASMSASEASGVSEPSQIAPLFDLCDDSHNHAEVHTPGPQLGELARSAEEIILFFWFI